MLNPDVHKKPSELHLLYKNHEIFDIGILQIRIRNSGAQPITEGEIAEPIRIQVEGATEIISATVVEAHPPEPSFQTTISGTKVELNKALLNPDDALTVEIDAITAEGGKFDISGVSGRVAGVQNIVFHKSLPERTKTATGYLAGLLVGGLVPLILGLVGALFSRLSFKRQMKAFKDATLQS